MKQTVNFHQFERAFNDIRPDNFTYDGLKALFGYLEDLELYGGYEEFELDVIGLCCNYCEWESKEELVESYGMTIEEIQANTFCFIEMDNGRYIIGNF